MDTFTAVVLEYHSCKRWWQTCSRLIRLVMLSCAPLIQSQSSLPLLSAMRHFMPNDWSRAARMLFISRWLNDVPSPSSTSLVVFFTILAPRLIQFSIIYSPESIAKHSNAPWNESFTVNGDAGFPILTRIPRTAIILRNWANLRQSPVPYSIRPYHEHRWTSSKNRSHRKRSWKTINQRQDFKRNLIYSIINIIFFDCHCRTFIINDCDDRTLIPPFVDVTLSFLCHKIKRCLRIQCLKCTCSDRYGLVFAVRKRKLRFTTDPFVTNHHRESVSSLPPTFVSSMHRDTPIAFDHRLELPLFYARNHRLRWYRLRELSCRTVLSMASWVGEQRWNRWDPLCKLQMDRRRMDSQGADIRRLYQWLHDSFPSNEETNQLHG